MIKQAFWFRYPCEGGICHTAVVADTLEKAFDKLSKEKGVDPLDIKYLNRMIEVLD